MTIPQDAGKPDVKAVKMEVTCRTCQAALPVSPRNRIIVCDYCGAKNVVPDEIWNVIAPPAPQQPLPPPDGPALPPPAVPRKKPPVALFIVIGIMFLLFVVPLFFGLCGACIPFVTAIFKTKAQSGSDIQVTPGEPARLSGTYFQIHARSASISPLDRKNH